jgi:hypothetical protein
MKSGRGPTEENPAGTSRRVRDAYAVIGCGGTSLMSRNV